VQFHKYVRDNLIPRTEPATNNVTNDGAKKAVINLADLRSRLSAIADNLSAARGVIYPGRKRLKAKPPERTGAG
jgi:hypothetical protein